MKKPTLVAAVAALCLLSACSLNRNGAENAVRDVLKDPDSAEFGEFYYNSSTQKGCLIVNAKNSLGGYTGDQMAFVIKTEEGWVVERIFETSMEGCQRVLADSTT